MTQLIIVSPGENEGIYRLYTEEGELVSSVLAFDKETAAISFNTIALNRDWQGEFGTFRLVFVQDSNISEHELLISAKEYENHLTKRRCPECLN